MALRTVIYLRKSSKDKDEKQIHSIPRQREDILDFVERYNKAQLPEDRLVFDPDKDIIAEDASAKELGRPKFHEMVKSIQKNQYDVLLCTELSRLSRNAVDTGTVVQLLEPEDRKKPAHLKRVQTKDKLFTTTPTDKFTLALFLTVSKFENDQRAVNTSSGMAHQKGKGVTTHKAPLGYINVGETKGDKWVERDTLIWGSVRTIWEMFLTGEYSVTNLKHEADELGITVLERGGTRHLPVETTYRGMLCNRYYTGVVKKVNKETGKVDWIEGKHPAMVTEEEFDRAQYILQGQGYKHQPISKTVSIENILNELLVCGKCTTEIHGIVKPTRMTFEQKLRYTCLHCKHRFSSAEKKPCPECGTPISEETKTDVHHYYRCGKRSSGLACSHDFYGKGKLMKNIQAEDIQEYLDSQLSKLHITERLFEVLRRQLYTLWLDGNKNVQKKREEHRKNLKKLEDERLNIQRKGLEHPPETDTEREDYDHLMDANKKDQEDLQHLIEDTKEKQEETFERAWQSLQALREAKSVFAEPKIGIEPKRRLILSLISNLKITDNKWEIIWKSPFDAVAKASFAKTSNTISGKRRGEINYNWLPRLDSNQGPCR